ncbi:DUF2027 domain-containing protein [Dysgonomonas macrotermitis]|uniref:Smr domain-containing protein n=1 Tax=Dysgonomonas macrotermitis TaxID=1346286 RepID=A0A1M5EE19_9BACT|nr:DUF2027 domain-containing protein [Dysgonomonas macrotermitis]SHF77479.1 Smr domain-containing protein [Dysgonomonas macrotermitis]
MKIGDKVRFLNTTGGGIVKGFQGKDVVIVDDDGFDTPVLIRECIVIEPAHDTQVRQSVKPQNVTEPTQKTYQEKPEEDTPVIETKEGDLITACLAYLPLDEKSLSTTAYECYLVNDSNYFLSYNYMSRNDHGWVSRAAGLIEPNTKIFLEEFNKTDLNDLEKICVQFIAFKKDKPFSLKNPCSAEIRLDTVKFYKLHSFRDNDYFDENAIIYYLMKKDLVEKELTIEPEVLAVAMREKQQSERPRIQPAKKKETSPILEIDLHIDELVDSTAGLEASDILDYQLSKFREIMDENKSNKGQKIVFIHGKGEGVLKKAILDELKNKYKHTYIQDASFREYGFGATMVTIK